MELPVEQQDNHPYHLGAHIHPSVPPANQQICVALDTSGHKSSDLPHGHTNYSTSEQPCAIVKVFLLYAPGSV